MIGVTREPSRIETAVSQLMQRVGIIDASEARAVADVVASLPALPPVTATSDRGALVERALRTARAGYTAAEEVGELPPVLLRQLVVDLAAHAVSWAAALDRETPRQQVIR